MYLNCACSFHENQQESESGFSLGNSLFALSCAVSVVKANRVQDE